MLLSIFKDINDEDDQTVGYAIAHALDPSRSDGKDISDEDDKSFVESSNPVGLKSDGGGEGLVLVGDAKKTHTFINHTVSNIQ